MRKQNFCEKAAVPPRRVLILCCRYLTAPLSHLCAAPPRSMAFISSALLMSSSAAASRCSFCRRSTSTCAAGAQRRPNCQKAFATPICCTSTVRRACRRARTPQAALMPPGPYRSLQSPPAPHQLHGLLERQRKLLTLRLQLLVLCVRDGAESGAGAHHSDSGR